MPGLINAVRPGEPRGVARGRGSCGNAPPIFNCSRGGGEIDSIVDVLTQSLVNRGHGRGYATSMKQV